MIAVVTRLELKGLRYLPLFLRHAVPSSQAAQQADGNIFSSTKALKWRTHCTLTVWKDMSAMRTFVNSEPHLRAMEISGKISKNTAFSHWDTDTLPSWEEALARLTKTHSMSTF